MANEDTPEMFPKIIVRESEINDKSRSASSKESYPEITPGTITLNQLSIRIPPLGYDDYYSLSRKAQVEKTRGLNADELSFLIKNATENPYREYGNSGRVDGFNELVGSGKVMKISPRLITPGEIIRTQRNYTWTGIVYVPEDKKLPGAGGALVFDFTDPDFPLSIEDLVSKIESGDKPVRFVPGQYITTSKKYNEWESEKEHRILTEEEFEKDPLMNAVFPTGIKNLSQIKRAESRLSEYKALESSAKGNFHIYYNSPEKINIPHGAIVSITINEGIVCVDASNKSVGNLGFDAFSKYSLLSKGFLFCSDYKQQSNPDTRTPSQ